VLRTRPKDFDLFMMRDFLDFAANPPLRKERATTGTLLSALEWTDPETRCELLIDDFDSD
jgi:hypothetical protein